MASFVRVEGVGSDAGKTVSGIGAIFALVDAGNAQTIVSKEIVRTSLHAGSPR